MITHFLGREQVEAYCKDFAERINSLADIPSICCPIGFSGIEIFKVISQYFSTEIQNKPMQPLTYHRDGEKVSIPIAEGYTEEQIISNIKGVLEENSLVLVIDSSIHSGSSMVCVMDKLREMGAKNFITYSLVIKQSSKFIPHMFSVVVGDHDRALFLLDSIPNNRLSKPGTYLKGCLRALKEEDAKDIKNQKLDTDVASISSISWGDLWYDCRANNFRVYIVESERHLIGFIKYKLYSKKRYISLDIVAVDKAFQKKGAGAAMFRWVETTARNNNCLWIQLWAIEHRVKNYEKFGYKPLDKWIETGNGERFQLMRKQLLYHFDLNQLNKE